ncbi:MAG: hypothetical protein JXA04_08190 [Gammaproteobacteria bacterium]|nr:hypothetical protein [Gammaproteobacteria bacterium]
MNINILVKATLAGMLTLITTSVYAEGLYIGAGIGKTSLDAIEDIDALKDFADEIENDPDFTSSSSFEDGENAKKVFLGYEMSDNFALEGGLLDMGDVLNFQLEALDTGGGPIGDVAINTTSSLDGSYLSAIGKISVLGLLSLQGKVGTYMWESESSINIVGNVPGAGAGTGTVSNDGTDVFYGIGVNIAFVTVEYEVYDIEGEDVNYLGASISLGF